jgi:glutamate--cysteine ligase
VGDFDPCLVLLNNDLSSGAPDILQDLEQMMAPPLSLGWANRLKSAHFAQYQAVTEEFAELVEIDSWLINPLFRNCGEINYMKREGEDCLVKNVNRLLDDIRAKYKEYDIDKDPYVIVKADAGTYGMGVMTVHSAEEILELNRKQRTKMSTSKGGSAVSRVIMQEGVYTFETWGKDQAVAEPVVYMLDHFVVGGFYRVHTERGINENLNAPGMHFEPLAFVEPCNVPDNNMAPDANPNRFYTYGVIARLALLAAAREYAQHQ